MSNAPEYNIDLSEFKKDPYPDLAEMRRSIPIARVPQLNATLFTKRDDIFINEKKIDVFIYSGIEWRASNILKLDKEQSKKMIEVLNTLEDLDDVQNIFINANLNY